MAFNNNKIYQFTVTVVVPVGTPANQVGLLNIEAEARGQTFTLYTSSQALVTVAPYYVFYINSPMPYKEITPAKPVVFEIEIDNRGNSEDSYDMVIENQDELAQNGWTVSLSTSTAMRVGSMQARFLKMSIQPAFSSTIYKAKATEIMVQGISHGSQYSSDGIRTGVLPFIVYEKGTYIDPTAAGAVAISICLILLVAVPVFIGARKVIRRFRKL
jgi:hypothetical protein